MDYFASERPRTSNGIPYMVRPDGSRAGYRTGVCLPSLCISPNVSGGCDIYFYVPNGDASFSYQEIHWTGSLDDFMREWESDPEKCMRDRFHYEWKERAELVWKYGKEASPEPASQPKAKPKPTTLADLGL